MSVDKASGILVCPKWISAVFWPYLCPNGIYVSAVKDFIEYQNPHNMFKAGYQKDCVFARSPFIGHVLMLYLDFKVKMICIYSSQFDTIVLFSTVSSIFR